MAAESTDVYTYEEMFDPKIYVETLVEGTGDIPDSTKFLLEELSKAFTSGGVKGETLIDMGAGPCTIQLLSAANSFNEIIVADYTERNCRELEKWWKDEPGAFDFTAFAKRVCEMEGNRQTWIEMEENLRRTIRQVLRCDITKCNPLAPIVLTRVDCILTNFCIENVCTDETSFCEYLKNMTSVLKPGGHLILTALLECTFYKMGKHRLPSFPLTESFARTALNDTGFEIRYFKVLPSTDDSPEPLTDHTGILFVLARKEL
ncbi:nicotinamide N-methyltransferase-like [Ambystoma mexicanum]|uniref:nicotinamide N-methyltransferase-like n=1 Tax=Ambystoma mexicanum TaxID=8296 RepID=UPI0037E77952